MTSKQNINDLTCCLCKQVYTDPILLLPCSHSFDRHCILRYNSCPVGQCNAPVTENCLFPNYSLKNLADSYNQSAKSIYELFLLDTSTSMWYSDFFFGLLGKSRFEIAQNFIKDIFEQRWNSSTNKVSLVTFDTMPLEQFTFDVVRQQHLQILQNLHPNGSCTGLFDAIKFCLEKFERLNQTTSCYGQCLYILTDGGDNFSSGGNKEHYIHYVKEYTRKLSIVGHIIHVGDKNLFSSKRFSEQIDYQFHHFNSGNASQFVNSFLSSSNNHVQNVNHMINALPDACTTPVRPVLNPRKIAVLE